MLPHELRNNVRPRILENFEKSEKSQIFIKLLPSSRPPLEIKILSVLIKISSKTEIEHFLQWAISHENWSLSQILCK